MTLLDLVSNLVCFFGWEREKEKREGEIQVSIEKKNDASLFVFSFLEQREGKWLTETGWPLEREREPSRSAPGWTQREALRSARTAAAQRRNFDREKTIDGSRNRREGRSLFFLSQKVRTSIVAVVLCFAPFVVRGRRVLSDEEKREKENERSRLLPHFSFCSEQKMRWGRRNEKK